MSTHFPVMWTLQEHSYLITWSDAFPFPYGQCGQILTLGNNFTSPGCYLDECPFGALSQVDPCTWTSDWQLKSAKCTKFLIFMNGTWPSGAYRHSAKWYPRLAIVIILLAVCSLIKCNRVWPNSNSWTWLLWLCPTRVVSSSCIRLELDPAFHELSISPDENETNEMRMSCISLNNNFEQMALITYWRRTSRAESLLSRNWMEHGARDGKEQGV